MKRDFNTVEWSIVCDEYYAESQIDVKAHVMEDHTLKERLSALVESGAEPEDTNA